MTVASQAPRIVPRIVCLKCVEAMAAGPFDRSTGMVQSSKACRRGATTAGAA